MFSIAAINDTDSKEQWEPLAPTKEAQEFHLSQAYHEGLLKLQAKEYEKARQLLESVLRDPLIANSKVESASDNHLLQLRFLVLKNLASVFLQQGSSHYENALHCYLQAVEIDDKDSVVWNQLGSLSCSMGLLSISRWAFEQGLLCSPNNWNCMEKLLEVLIAIGDEVTCLSVAELVLRHWPSHSRALHVKKTIEQSEPVPFAPRGIDKLEPKHVRLKFLDKRKASDENLHEGNQCKKLKQNIELHLAEASWACLTDALIEILLQVHGCTVVNGAEKSFGSGDIRLVVHLPSGLESTGQSEERKGLNFPSMDSNSSYGDHNGEMANVVKEKETTTIEEQPQERRSSRLERLRSRKPGNEYQEFADGKDQNEIVNKHIRPFISCEAGTEDIVHSSIFSSSSQNQMFSYDTEFSDVSTFVKETSNNYGAYHMGHLLLEEAARRGLMHQDAFSKFLEMEKLTRHWGKDRSLECNLFLAELYYDFGYSFSETSRASEFMSEASYHICKIIESVALAYPFPLNSAFRGGSSFGISRFQETEGISANNSACQDTPLGNFSIAKNNSIWIRFFWLSGRLSILDGNKAKAHDELCVSLSLLSKKEDDVDSELLVRLPHCRHVKEITFDRVLHLISILKIYFLMEKTLGEMVEKDMHMECTDLLSPLLFSTKDVHLDTLPLKFGNIESKGVTFIELSALDILIKSCEKMKPVDIEVCLNCHRRKLQILMAIAGIDGCLASCKFFDLKSGSRTNIASDTELRESSTKHWNILVLEEVKAISQCISQMKNSIDTSADSNSSAIPVSSINDIQSLMFSVMCQVASVFFCKKSSGLVVADQAETSCFIEAAISFCKLQHLNPAVSIGTQVDLIVAMHDLLAEYGICCVGEGGEGEEGIFLKFAIKRLLALDMKLKANMNASNKDTTELNGQICASDAKMPQNETKSDTLIVRIDQIGKANISALEKDISIGVPSRSSLPDKTLDKDGMGACVKQGSDSCSEKFEKKEQASDHLSGSDNKLSVDEREELELKIDYALDQCFLCLYGLNIRSDSSYEDDLATHRNTSRGNYQTKEQCADVFQYILPCAKASSKTGLVKLRRVLRAIRKHFPQPPEEVLVGNAIDKFLDDPDLCEDKLSEEAGSNGFLETLTEMVLPCVESFKQRKMSSVGSSDPYLEVYCNLYYFLALSEEMSATDKWPGFVLTKEGEEFVQYNANLFKYDLLYNPLRFESWQRLANIYDEEVDLMLNDGSKHINVAGWRKNASLPLRVETSRRRSKRCLFMSLALAKTSDQRCEIHELLALVYYDSLQNVVPIYDQRSVVPLKDAAWTTFCENSTRHFKKAFDHKQEWSHAYYIGKLSEKLGCSHETSLSYYDKAICLNPTAVDPLYRMHASRLKFLYRCEKQNLDLLKVLSGYAFSQSKRETVMTIINEIDAKSSLCDVNSKNARTQENSEELKHKESLKLEVWNILYSDCLSALQTCVEGELKHFHKARYMLAQGLYKRGGNGDLERAKDELSFCFKSSRSSFTINMWEIDSMVKKGRRKTLGLSGSKKSLEVNLPESSRKFITCIRKYLLFYLNLLEETGDIGTLDRAYISLRADKRFSLCIEDIVPVALGRYIKSLISSMTQAGTFSCAEKSSEHISEKIFSLFIEQGNLWPEICGLPEIKGPDTSESSLYGYLHEYITSLERNGKLETLEAINEKIRKRFKNPKLSNSNCARICRHASVAWCRSLIIGLAQITPMKPKMSSETQVLNQSDSGLESIQQLFVDLQTDEFWSSTFEDLNHLKDLEIKWSPILSEIKNIMISRATDENLETANSLLRSSYNFYRESSCVMPPSGLKLYMVPSRSAIETQFQPSTEGVEMIDLSIPRKLIMWAYTLLHGRCANVSTVVKYCEENAKSKVKKGVGTSSLASNMSTHNASATQTGVGKDGIGSVVGSDVEAACPAVAAEKDGTGNATYCTNPQQSLTAPRKDLFAAPQLQHCNTTTMAERSNSTAGERDPDKS